ncbi:MAG: replication factor C small subunit [Candidatus Diapherotrites archaeon]|nr:replication factor C small subunit [Candidatus Diapherotrites archaeon]
MQELPWVEKYRPETLGDVIGQNDITQRLESYVKKGSVPNLLFSGPAGIGKTSASVALAKELFGKDFERNFLELNASDSRGIDVVRGTIKDFARTLAFNANFKIIFLDESDALTADAQQALRRTMEKFTRTTRFILSCNYSSRIIEPIQSRCVVFRFRPLGPKEMKARLEAIAKTEKISVEAKALDAIVYVAMGDMRKAINILQASSSIAEKVSEKSVFDVSSRAKPEEIREMIVLALKGDFLEARKKLDELMFEHGMSAEDIMLQVYREIADADENFLPSKIKIALINVVGEYNFRVVEGANERIQLEAMLAQFMQFGKK